MPADRKPVVPGESPVMSEPDALDADDLQAKLATQAAELASLKALMGQVLGAAPAEMPAALLPTQEEAQMKARQTGKFELSRDGYIGPKVIQPARPA